MKNSYWSSILKGLMLVAVVAFLLGMDIFGGFDVL